MEFENIQWQYIFNPALAIDSLPFVLSGIGYTLLISAFSFVLGTLFGLMGAVLKSSKNPLLSMIGKAYISFFRGVPALVVLFILYFGFPFVGIILDPIPASILGFTLTSSAYSAEIWRSSILAIDDGQWDAGRALGLSTQQIMRKIILPQSTKISIPPMSNILLDLVKGSSLTAMITVPEIFQKAKIVGGRENDYMTMYILVAIIYWVICSIYAKLQERLERKLDVDAKKAGMESLSI